MIKATSIKLWRRLAMTLAAAVIVTSPASAQVETVDPNDVIGTQEGDIPTDAPLDATPTFEETVEDGVPTDSAPQLPVESDPTVTDDQLPPSSPADEAGDRTTYQKDDLIGAAEGVFGKGAQGLGKLMEDILKKQGEPNGYIVGREGGGAFVVGLRYGSGTLFHKVEGERKVYWTGPSIGFDAGANAGSTFVLVYNLYDTEDLYKRFGSAEGVAYLVGGFNASYMRRGDVVLIPIRVGAGLRLGANVGYMKMSKKQRWLPF